MRSTIRLLATAAEAATTSTSSATTAAKPRYLPGGAATGLTGLYTSSSPRSTLLFIYQRTLDRLSSGENAPPPTSLYRQSIEALTKHRMAIVSSFEAPGHAAWVERTQHVLKQGYAVQREKLRKRGETWASLNETPENASVGQEHAAMPIGFRTQDGSVLRVRKMADGQIFTVRDVPEEVDDRMEDPEGDSAADVVDAIRKENPEELLDWEPEPQLTAEQVEEIETKIGAGLIEEVIQVAEGELELADVMIENKVWQDLEEKPTEGQWTYFDGNRS